MLADLYARPFSTCKISPLKLDFRIVFYGCRSFFVCGGISLLALSLPLHHLQPNDIETAVQYCGLYGCSIYFQRKFFPRSPASAVQCRGLVFAVIVGVGFATGTTDNVERVKDSSCTPAVLLASSNDIHFRGVTHFFQVIAQGFCHGILVVPYFGKAFLQFEEEWCFVFTQVAIYPVFGIEEYLAIRHPNLEILHPLPLFLLGVI